MRVPILATLAMVAFAANSVIARLALDDGAIDPGTFTLLRLLSGACALALILRFSSRTDRRNRVAVGSWSSAALLLIYAATFSYAYVNLGAAAGALTLFAVVQIVMFTVAVRSGEQPGLATFTGLLLAMAGLVALVGPGVSRPDPIGALLMSIAGVAWAGYTLRGRTSERPILMTSGNFLRSLPLALALWLPSTVFQRDAIHVDTQGVALAVASGAVASGIGYAIWYAILPSLTRVQSGIVQLLPAPLATLGGLVLLGEPITARIISASLLILSGVLIGVLRPGKKKSNSGGDLKSED